MEEGPTFAILLKLGTGEQMEMLAGKANNITQKQHCLLGCRSISQRRLFQLDKEMKKFHAQRVEAG